MFEEPVSFLLDVFRRTARCWICSTREHTFVNPVLAKHYGMPDLGPGRATGCVSPTPAATAAAGCCRWRCS